MATTQSSIAGNADEIAARIDRLPIASFHRRTMWIVSLALFFDVSDTYTFSYAAPGLITYLGVSVNQVALITSASFVGMFIGAVSGGLLSDRFGRRPMMLITAAVVSLGSLANALSPNLAVLFVTRCLTGFGLSALMVVATTYLSEMFPSKVRGEWQGWARVVALCGMPITGWIARLVVPMGPNGWRLIFIWGFLGVFFVWIARHLAESPRWLSRHGQEAQADEILAKIEEQVSKEAGPLPVAVPSAHVEEKHAHWTTVFGPTYRKRTFTLWGIWCFQAVGFLGIQTWAPTLLMKHGMNIAQSLSYTTIINLGLVPGAMIASWLADRIERKYSISASALAIAILGLLFGLSFKPILIVTVGFFLGVLLQISASMCFAYTPEQYPTDVRTVGTGLAYGIGRLSNVVNPFLIAGIFNKFGYTPVFVYIAGAWMATAVITSLFGAETTGKSLEVLNPVST